MNLMEYKKIAPGLGVAFITALAALFLSEHYGAPAMLFALLLGIALSFLYEEQPCRQGIEFTASVLLKLGIALLGLRIALADLFALGWQTIILLIAAIASTILIGVFCARSLKLKTSFGALTAGAVSICGASAALAISAVLPDHKDKERDTLLTVICVTSMSTVAMVAYPIVAAYLELNNEATGLFLGATIHDVAQVVGAGYSVSDPAGDAATLVKLVRVSLLLPVILCMLMVLAWRSKKSRTSLPTEEITARSVPLFLLAFFLLILINSFINLPTGLVTVATDFSRFALVTAIAAIGMKSNLAKLSSVGWKPLVLMLIETLWLTLVILLAISLFQLS